MNIIPGVTGGTICRCYRKEKIGMTRLAGYQGVLTQQLKYCHRMVEYGKVPGVSNVTHFARLTQCTFVQVIRQVA
jgi:hypothetical protein